MLCGCGSAVFVHLFFAQMIQKVLLPAYILGIYYYRYIGYGVRTFLSFCFLALVWLARVRQAGYGTGFGYCCYREEQVLFFFFVQENFCGLRGLVFKFFVR